MAETVQIAEYFYLQVPDKPGEAARFLAALAGAGVNLLAFSGFPAGRKAQIDFVPEDAKAFKAAAKKGKWQVSAAKKVFLISGDDRVGAGAELMGKLAQAKINVIASQAVTAGGGRFAMILWVAPADVRKAAKVLGVAVPAKPAAAVAVAAGPASPTGGPTAL
jgi:predicted amino acid-binding ACT domain protein